MIRTAWHSGELELAAGDDPFADGPQRIEDVGTPIVLAEDGEARLQRQLVRTLTAEARLEERSVTCAIKDAQDTSCFACPLFKNDDSPEAQLCALGRLQERLCTEIVVTRRGGRR